MSVHHCIMQCLVVTDVCSSLYYAMPCRHGCLFIIVLCNALSSRMSVHHCILLALFLVSVHCIILDLPLVSVHCVNSLFCLAHGCTNSRFITAEPQNPRTREHVFCMGSVARALSASPVRNKGVLDLISTRQALIGSRGQWHGGCHGHKRRTTQSPFSSSLALFHFLLTWVSLVLFRFTPHVVLSFIFPWIFVWV